MIQRELRRDGPPTRENQCQSPKWQLHGDHSRRIAPPAQRRRSVFINATVKKTVA
jgi:hypothetical protein